MKLRKIGVVLLALLLAGMAMVPMVSATEQANYLRPDKGIVDNFTLAARTPLQVQDMRSKGLTENEIAQYLLKMPIARQPGWTDADDKKVQEYFKQFPETGMQSISPMYQEVQKDGRMAINEYDYHGINGYMNPGNLEVSNTGTEAHYFTSHIGNSGNWVEVGVARFNFSSSQYIVYTYDSGRPSGQQWKTWGTTNRLIVH